MGMGLIEPGSREGATEAQTCCVPVGEMGESVLDREVGRESQTKEE